MGRSTSARACTVRPHTEGMTASTACSAAVLSLLAIGYSGIGRGGEANDWCVWSVRIGSPVEE